MITALLILSLVGMLSSLYAYYVKRRWQKDKSYNPFCDISKGFSCTKAFSSRYGLIFGLPNSAYGIFFYILLAVTLLINAYLLAFCLILFSVLLSVYLAYVSIVKLRNICPVCLLMYLINFLLLILIMKDIVLAYM